jgi:hypothetical protein
MTNIPPAKRQKSACEQALDEQATEILGLNYAVIATHVPSHLFPIINNVCLIRHLVRLDIGYEDNGWESRPLRLYELSKFDSDYSDNPSLHKFFSMMSPQHIIRFMDNLHALDSDKYYLFKRLLTGKACKESDVTVWKKWVEQLISHLPHFSVASYFFMLDDPKLGMLRCRQPSQASLEDPVLTPEDCQMLSSFFHEDWHRGRLCRIYPQRNAALQNLFTSMSDEQFCRMLEIFDTFEDRLFSKCFKKLLENRATPREIQYYQDKVCSFSSLPGVCNVNLKDSHLLSLQTYQPSDGIQIEPNDHTLLAQFQEPDWWKPPLCQSGKFPVVKSGLMNLVNSLSKKDFERILNLFYIIDLNSYESFKKIITNQDSMDDHMLYEQALREFPTRP